MRGCVDPHLEGWQNFSSSVRCPRSRARIFHGNGNGILLLRARLLAAEPRIPSALLRAVGHAMADEVRLLPGHIVIRGFKKRTSRIADPLLWKQRNGIVIGDSRSRLFRFAGQRRIQGSRKIAASAEWKMPDLRGPGIDLDQVRTSGARFQHEIEAAEAGEPEATNHDLDSLRHFRIFIILNKPQNRSVASCTNLLRNFKMRTRQHFALPAENRAGGFLSGDECLDIHGMAMPAKR